MDRVRDWIEVYGLDLGVVKLKAIVLTVRRAFRPPVILFNGLPIRVIKELKYLGGPFTTHLRRISTASYKVAMAVARLMTNIGGSCWPQW